MKTRKYKKSVKSKKSLKHRKKGQKGGAYGVTMNSLANNAKSNVKLLIRAQIIDSKKTITEFGIFECLNCVTTIELFIA